MSGTPELTTINAVVISAYESPLDMRWGPDAGIWQVPILHLHSVGHPKNLKVAHTFENKEKDRIAEFFMASNWHALTGKAMRVHGIVSVGTLFACGASDISGKAIVDIHLDRPHLFRWKMEAERRAILEPWLQHWIRAQN